jgi:hypothetical protein
MVTDPLPSLSTPRRAPRTGGGNAGWLPVALALVFLVAAVWLAWAGPSAPLGRLDRVLTPDTGGAR